MKHFQLLFIFLISSVILFAQEDSFFFEDDFSSNEEVPSSFISFDSGGSVGGFTDYYNEVWSSNLFLNLDFTAQTSVVDLVSNIDVKINNLDNFSNFPLQNNQYNSSFYVDSLFARFYHKMFDLEVGLLKPIWGNADGIHAVDVLNPIDYSNLFGTSYLESKIAQQMVKLNIPIARSSLLEVAYLPTFKGDYIPLSGKWAPLYIKNMENTIREMAYAQAVAQAAQQDPTLSYEQLVQAVSPSVEAQLKSFDYTIHFEESEYFVDSQIGARFTTTLSSMDLGLTYYYGFLKQPTIDPQDIIATSSLNLVYNRVQTIGFDVAAQVGSFNLKGEVGYNLTEDFEGNDPSINNNSLKYILGFDINLPINNMNLLIQGIGNTIINSSEIGMLDSEYSSDDEYTTITLMGRVSDTYLNDTLSGEITGSFNVLDQDFMVKPKVSYSITDNSKCYVEYLLLEGNEDTTFGQYRDNDTFKIGVEINF
ncbi:MAG: hypothetical protein JXR64_02185 [Spirochaetales bacterium]|nr:hypothetical protein [Spirochaetales bacterium]